MAPDSSRHLDEEEIELYAMGDIPEEESARAEEHLLICEACRERVQASGQYIHAMRDAAGQLRRKPLVDRRAGWWWPRLVPALAAVALLALVAWQASRNVGYQRPAFAVSLAAVRGSNPAAPAPAGAPLDLTLDLNTLPVLASYRVAVVNRDGKSVWQGVTASGTTCRVPALHAGTYYVRISSPEGELLREYALEAAGR